MLRTTLGILAMVTAAAGGAAAQTNPLPPGPDAAAIVQRHSTSLDFTDGRISGPGAELLLREAGTAQFVMLAEVITHVDHATPEFMAALFGLLHDRHGFDYVALEQDPFGMQLVSGAPVRGSLERVAEQARRYPYAFTFINDEELRMMADAGRRSTGRWRPVWGFDQEFGATLVLEELSRLAPSREAAAAVGEMLGDARRHERLVPDFGDWRGTRDFEAGHFVGNQSVANLPRVQRLRALFAAAAGTRADELLRGLEASTLIYSYHYRAREFDPATGEPYGYHSNAVREQLMKDQFLDNYRIAEAADGRPPRVLIKAGSNHLIRGRNFTNVFSLGGFLHEFAIANRSRALTIAMLPVQEAWVDFAQIPAELRPLLPSRDLSRPTLVDLRPLRAHLHRRQNFGLEGEDLRKFEMLVHGMDFALFLPSRAASFSLTQPERRRR
ncbi:MAG TPA: hypothetical protein VF704_00150 [Allosphingosinicella sp.]|jgi:hypothetical protein